jgi:uncharacterized protein (TIGR02996 family)
MSDADALVAAVLAAPADDLPRLIYADYLDDLGTPAAAARAEFVRLQCDTARTGTDANQAREKALLEAFGTAWLAPLRAAGEPLQNLSTHGQFRRGFVEVVWMPAPVFVQKAAKLFSRCPVTELRVTKAVWNDMIELFACEHLGRLETLDLSERKFSDALAVRLAASEPARKLKRVRLRNCGLGSHAAAALADAGRGWPLVELDVSLNPMPAHAVAGLRERYGRAVRYDPA